MKYLRLLLLLALPTALALLSLIGSGSHESLKAAIVNDDTIATLPDGTPLPGGRQMIAELTKDTDSAVSWTVLSKETAMDGLRDGTYSAVVVIPQEFSSTLASVLSQATGKRPSLDVHYAATATSARTLISEQLVTAASSRFGSTLTLAYIQGGYKAMSTLALGIGEANMGAGELHSGINQASDGARKLASGARQADDGARALSQGNARLADASSTLASGSSTLVTGMTNAQSGSSRLTQGADDLNNAIAAYTGGVWHAYKALTGSSATPMSILAGSTALTHGIERIHNALAAADTSPLAALPRQLEQGSQAAQDIASGAEQLPALITACQGGIHEACGAATQYAQGIAQGAQSLASQLQEGAHAAQEAGDHLTGQLSSLSDGVGQALDASRQLSGGINAFAEGMAPLATEYGAQLRLGAQTLAQGASQLDAGSNALAHGIRELAGGANQLAVGAGQAANGAQALAAGTGELAQGATNLNEGITQLSEGSHTLSQGLNEAEGKIPSYSAEQIADSSAALADPIDVTASYQGSEKHSTLAGPLIIGALWVSGLITTLALGRMRRKPANSSLTPIALTLRALLPALGVSIGAGLLLGLVLLATGTLGSHAIASFALIILASSAFAILHEALYAALGSWGTVGTSLLALLVQLLATDGLITQGPTSGPFALVATILPVPSTAATMSSTIGLPEVVGMAHSCILLLVWALIALVTTVAAIARSRQVSLAHLKTTGAL